MSRPISGSNPMADKPNATSTSNTKDVIENKLNELVCSGQITLVAASNKDIAANWVAAYNKYDTSAAAPAATHNHFPDYGTSASGSRSNSSATTRRQLELLSEDRLAETATQAGELCREHLTTGQRVCRETANRSSAKTTTDGDGEAA